MKKWKIVLAVCLAVLVLAATPLAVLAAGNNAAAARAAARTQLVIVQPRAVGVGQEMQLTVLTRFNQKPVSAAEIWAVGRDNIESIRNTVQSLNKNGADNLTLQDYARVLDANGSRLGRTNSEGKLTHSFVEAGYYCLVAVKPGYRAGFSALLVRNEMTVNAVKRAAPATPVTITVTQKGTILPENAVGVWAVDISNARALKLRLIQVVKDNKGNLADVNWSSELNGLAVSLGTTDAVGQVTYSFDQGNYILVAVKKGYFPAYARIAIIALKPAATNSKATLN